MRSSRHDQDFASLHAGAPLPGHVLDVVALTADAGLLATLREASGPEHAIWHAQSADAAVDLLVGGRCGILIADLGSLRGDAAALLDRLHAQFPELVLMATGRRDEEGAVASLVGAGLIYRFLHKPVSPARAGLFITAATRRYHELRNLEPIGMTTVRTMAARPHAGKMVAGVAVAVIAVIIGLVLWRTVDPPAPIVVQESSVHAPTAAEEIADRLARAEIAYATGRFSEPRGDNALEYFRTVLTLQPEHAEAKEGVARVVAALEARLAEALQARNAPQGAAALMALQRAQPDHPRLDALRAELISISRSVAATPGGNTALAPSGPSAEVARKQPPAAPDVTQADEVNELTAAGAAGDAASAGDELSAPETALEPAGPPAPSAEDLLRVAQLRERGALIAPAGDNAYQALLAIRDAFPEADEVRAEQQRLAFALLERARTALAADDVGGAAVLLTRADSLVPGMETTRALRQQLATAQAQHEFATNIVQAATLRRVREAAAVYPRDAERDGVEGWVDVEFTIAPDGSTQDLVVRDADNREIFEKSALDSVRRWRFEPVMRGGEPVAQRAVLRVRFVLR